MGSSSVIGSIIVALSIDDLLIIDKYSLDFSTFIESMIVPIHGLDFNV
jgi:hypothetical protein